MKSLSEDRIKKGTAFESNGSDFIFAVESASAPSMIMDDQTVTGLHQISGSNLWFYTAQLRTGVSHRFHYMVNGARLGGSYDVPAYTPDSYARPGVPQGKLSEKLVHTSKLYDGMQSDYWIWVPAQYNPAVPAALMVWQDGERYITRNKEEYCQLCPSLYRLQEVTDNLIYDKKIPVMIHVFISPGTVNGKSLRSVEYDTVSDKYYQFLEQELLPEVYAKYNIRKDAYSRAIQGQSSGGIAAFNAAWNHPDDFSRVYTVVGSFTALAWKPGELDGGNIYPFKVRREPKRNLRVWTSDGSEDQEARSGSWPLQNIQLANSLKLTGYDFHFSFGGGTHHAALAVIGIAGMPHMAVARLRSKQNRTDLRAERGRKSQATLPRPNLQSLKRSIGNYANAPFGSASILRERRSSCAIRRYRYSPQGCRNSFAEFE